MLAFGAELAPWAIAWLGRTLVLAVFNAAVFFGIGFVMDRRFTRGLPLHALLLACAVFAAATPLIADARGVVGTAWRRAIVAADARAGGALGADASRHGRPARRDPRAPPDAARGASRTRGRASRREPCSAAASWR